jgi:hypothetical protein
MNDEPNKQFEIGSNHNCPRSSSILILLLLLLGCIKNILILHIHPPANSSKDAVHPYNVDVGS